MKNQITPSELRKLVANSNAHSSLKKFALQCSDQALADAIKDAGIQAQYFEFTCKANPTVSRLKLAGLFYDQLIKQYQSIGYGQGAYAIVPMIALTIGGQLAQYFNSIKYVEISKK